MRVFYSLNEFKNFISNNSLETTVSVGNFDGIHRGHKLLLLKNVEIAKATQTSSVVLTFDPHPVQFFTHQKNEFELLFSRVDQIEQLSLLNIDYLCIIKFNDEFSKIKALDFLNILKNDVKVKNLVLGSNFCFGLNREGTIDFIKNNIELFNFHLEIQNLKQIDSHIVSTSNIKKMLKMGEVNMANRLLERNFYITGVVQKGDQRGKSIGFPTANIISLKSKFLKCGVYKTRVSFIDSKMQHEQSVVSSQFYQTNQDSQNLRIYSSITNLGFHPTFKLDSNMPIIETHIFDWTGDCYGETIKVEFIEFLRPEMKFSGVEELKQQIQKDINRSKS